MAAVRTAVGVIYSQHESLIADAVAQGFDVSYEGGGLTKPGQKLAKWSIPFAATCVRESAIHDALVDEYGASAGSRRYGNWSTEGDQTWYRSSACKLLPHGGRHSAAARG